MFRGLEFRGVEGRVPGWGDGEAVRRVERPVEDEREWERDSDRDCVREWVRECVRECVASSFGAEPYGEEGRGAMLVLVVGTCRELEALVDLGDIDGDDGAGTDGAVTNCMGVAGMGGSGRLWLMGTMLF